MSTADFLLSREASIQGSILDERLTVERRREFKNEVVEAFAARFGVSVEYDRDVHIAVGTKASG